MSVLDVNWDIVLSHTVLLGVAYVLALPIGWNREQFDRSAGLRTFPLVALATCGFMLVGIDVVADPDAQVRTLGGIITGMGFIGGGSILKSDDRVSGTATAASLWTTGAIGVAVAWQRLEIALVLSMMTFCTLWLLPAAKPYVSDDEKEK